ncbi:MAG: NADH:flavin oxidoreductase/NADH oxidase family protein [Pseudomonadota bacterium]
MKEESTLFAPLPLPCGVVLKNRMIKSAMSDSLGDGCGNPTDEQIRLYERWAKGGVAASIIGEVQCSPHFAEKPGNLVLGKDMDVSLFKRLAEAGRSNASMLWLQLGNAGAMSYPPTSTPKGPSALDLPGLSCEAMSLKEVQEVPAEYARAAEQAKSLGFGGVEIHAAHGFLLSQFLSPLFNHRVDGYGGSLTNRMRIVLEVVDVVRKAVGPEFPVAIKLNSSDQLEGGFANEEALEVVAELDASSIDLIDISGGTYFPGAKSASDSAGKGPYFAQFAEQARHRTNKPLMLTGGFKTKDQALEALDQRKTDVVGLARALVIDPDLPNHWKSTENSDPVFPRFENPPEGGITAWYSMKLTAIGEKRDQTWSSDLETAIQDYDRRDKERAKLWNEKFRT